MADFDERKHVVLQRLASDEKDKSRAGGVDAPIAALIDRINGHSLYFTISSCSGRISIFSVDDGKKTKKNKKGGDWVYVSHATAVDSEVLKSVKEYCVTMAEGLLVFRFEPFILALECRTPAAAQMLVACAVSAGFRESGITGMGKRNIVGVRCSIRLEVPIVQAGQSLVTDEYLQFLTALANQKMDLNRQRTDTFLHKFIDQIENLSPDRSSDCLQSEIGSITANGTRDFYEKIDRESKKRLSALKGRQLRLLGRLKTLEDGRLRVINDTQTLKSQEHCQVKSSNRESNLLAGGGKSDDGCSVRAAHLSVFGEPKERLHCWSHTSIQWRNNEHSLLVYGGFGGTGRHARQGTPLLLDSVTGELQCLETSCAPPPRMAHVAVTIGESMVVIGGRIDPSTSLGDVCVLDFITKSWHSPKVIGDSFLPRHRHAAARVGEDIYIFGGMNQNTVLGDFYVLNTSSWEWRSLNLTNMPSARYSHSLAAIDQKLYLFGGRDARRAYGDLHVFCLQTNTWTEYKDFAAPRFSHSITAVDKWLVVLGGCPITHHGTDLLIIDVEQIVSRRIPLTLLDVLFVRHTASLLGTKLVVVGGGAACFAFGAKFNLPFSVDLESLLGSTSSTSLSKDDKCWILRVVRKSAKVGKDSLKQLGWLDQKRRPKVLVNGMHVAFPITEEAALYLINEEEMPSEQEEVVSKLVAIGGEVVEMQLAFDAHRPTSPSVTLEADISKLLQEVGLPVAHLEELPKRWERLGDMAILPAGALTSSTWSTIGPALWPVVASALRSRRLARQAPIAPTTTRDSKLVLLYGENGWVEHRENGLLYCFDATKCMFSSGNVSEKLRMASVKCSGETVVDFFAGIGYYVLPFLVRGGAKLVYACEWNPNAIEALRHNLRVNGVEDRCVVLEGGNRLTAPKGVADRVCLGLLPSSEGSWGVAVEALRILQKPFWVMCIVLNNCTNLRSASPLWSDQKNQFWKKYVQNMPQGGMLHVHGNVKDIEEAQWIEYLVSTIIKLATVLERHWEVKVVHLERVKWYAPHIRHLVADLQVKATNRSI